MCDTLYGCMRSTQQTLAGSAVVLPSYVIRCIAVCTRYSIYMQEVPQLSAKATRIANGGSGVQNGHSNGSYDVLSQYAKTYAQQGGQQLKVLGEASMKYLSGAVHNWRTGPTMDHSASPHAPHGKLTDDGLVCIDVIPYSICLVYQLFVWASLADALHSLNMSIFLHYLLSASGKANHVETIFFGTL